MIPHDLKMPIKMPKIKCCPSGKKMKQLYKYEYSEALGCPDRVPNGMMDLHDYIQQSANDVDFKSIGKMLVDTRDNVASHFTDDKGQELDITRLPRNIHEYEALNNKMRKSFDELDPDVKRLFADDFDVFSKSWRNGSIKGVFDTYNKAKQADVKPAAKYESPQESEVK